jgi:AcrR family transcriptional regulator
MKEVGHACFNKTSMITRRSFDSVTKNKSRRLPSKERRRQILKVAEMKFAETGLASTTTATLAEAAGVSEPMLYFHFEAKQKLFEEAVKVNTEVRLKVLRERFFSMPHLTPLECVAKMAESTVMACVGDTGNASIMAWALLETPEFAAEVYRAEIGSIEALWVTEIGTRFADSPLRTRLALHLVPYAPHACMAFGFWLATLHHKPATAQEHASLYAGGIVNVARASLDFSPAPESFGAAPSTLRC